MARCDWCKKSAENMHTVVSLGTTYKVCDKCKSAHDNEVCIECGQPIMGQMSIKGKCQACAQEEYEEKQRKAEEMANGINSEEYMYIYTSGVEFTEEDYERWVTFGQGNFTPEKSRMHKRNWLRKRLVEQGGWSKELVEENLDNIEKLMDKHISKVIDRKYVMVYYDGKQGTRITQFVDRIGNIFLIDRKK